MGMSGFGDGRHMGRPFQGAKHASADTELVDGRSERIRTSDPLVPNQMRYQAALHSGGGIWHTRRRTATRDAQFPKKGWLTVSPGLAPISSMRPARTSRTPLAGPLEGTVCSENGVV
jgi:hypothetical protein